LEIHEFPFPYQQLLRDAIPAAVSFCDYLKGLTGVFDPQDFDYIDHTRIVLDGVLKEYLQK
jgi:hypothetical protein